jgi:hypothetical protein
MSSHRPLGQSNILALCSFYPSTTTNWARTTRLSWPTNLITNSCPKALINDLHPLKDVIDSVTTALSLPIAGPYMQGPKEASSLESCSLGNKAIILPPTSVCSFLREDERNSDYTYIARP